MTQEASPPGFSLGLLNRSSHALPSSQHAFSERDRKSTLWSSHLYNLGCVLEERVVIANGLRLGIFAADPATAWLVDDDERLQNIMRSNSIGEDWTRLPGYIPAEDLLHTNFPHESSDADQFRSLLRFRDYISSLELERFYQQLLFAPDSAWADHLELAQAQAFELLDPANNVLPIISRIFDAVQLCADLLAWRTGLPLGDSDPWGVSPESAGPHVERLYLRYLDKWDEDQARTVRQAAKHVPYSDQFDAYNAGLLEEALLLKVIHFARLPEATQDDASAARGRIIGNLVPRDEALLAQRLGSQFAWASPLWRIAPADDRSLARASEAAAIMSGALVVLRQGSS